MAVCNVGSHGPNPPIPPGFDPDECPIIGLHFFGIGLGNDGAHARDIRFRRAVERLHKAGPRVLHEFLVQVGAERSIRTFLEDRIGSFASLDLDILAALTGDRMPPAPIHRVRQ